LEFRQLASVPLYALLLLAVVIALLGIGNTLALSIYERIREIGLLRAVGMTRRQLRSAIRLESVVIALQGTVLGLLGFVNDDAAYLAGRITSQARITQETASRPAAQRPA
jgi:cell division protein FtsX